LFINIDPIQVGGKLTADAMKAIISYGDGYSVCDQCRKPFRLDYIKEPPIADFHHDLAKFVNMDIARVIPGARRGFQAVADTYVTKGDPVLITALAHYTGGSGFRRKHSALSAVCAHTLYGNIG
jgi:Sep-tRNA:Cys-tRNA synthetase